MTGLVPEAKSGQRAVPRAPKGFPPPRLELFGPWTRNMPFNPTGRPESRTSPGTNPNLRGPAEHNLPQLEILACEREVGLRAFQGVWDAGF